MRPLIKHLWKTNRKQILERSLENCHARSLHSIMLLESPGSTIRLFFADGSHPMGNNCPQLIHAQSIGFHAHHCELTLVPVLGHVFNWLVEVDPENTAFSAVLGEYQYSSKILNGRPGFSKLGHRRLRTLSFQELKPEGTHMAASEIHTVYVDANRLAAWLVFEGKSDPSYAPLCWSGSDLKKFSFEGLYQPMSELQIESILEHCKLLY